MEWMMHIHALWCSQEEDSAPCHQSSLVMAARLLGQHHMLLIGDGAPQTKRYQHKHSIGMQTRRTNTAACKEERSSHLHRNSELDVFFWLFRCAAQKAEQGKKYGWMSDTIWAVNGGWGTYCSEGGPCCGFSVCSDVKTANEREVGAVNILRFRYSTWMSKKGQKRHLKEFLFGTILLKESTKKFTETQCSTFCLV